jgi:transketolase
MNTNTEISSYWQTTSLQDYNLENTTSLREQIGKTLVNIIENDEMMKSKLLVFDAEVGNSTFTGDVSKLHPENFFQSYIAEQTMVSAALGSSIAGKVPVISTFSAFLSRAADQFRMAQYSLDKCNLNVVGTHAGVSIGEDGPSQMAVEDISFFRAFYDSVVLYPSDAVSLDKLLKLMIIDKSQLKYMRVTRANLPNIYSENEEFKIGGSKVLQSSNEDDITLVGAGITLHEIIKAAKMLKEKKNINVRIIDLYSVKPLDLATIGAALRDTKSIYVVEDHLIYGGLYESICATGIINKPIFSLAVNVIPKSGKMAELLALEKINVDAIFNKVVDTFHGYNQTLRH